MQKLKEEFEANGGTFKDYKIGDLFEKIETKTLKYKVGDLDGKHDNIYSLPALTAGIVNQGLSCYVPRKEATILKNVISVSANGANSGVMFYQPNEFTVLQDSYAIRYKSKELKSNHYLYFVTALQKTIYGNFDWTNKAGWNRIKNYCISVPTKNNQIDFDYIEECIRVLEEERIRVLEAYLKVTGLDKYILTKEEQEAYDTIHNGGGDFKLYTIGSLFRVYSPKKRFNANTVKFGGKHPYVVRTSQNNGIRDYITEDEKYLSPANTFSFGQDTATVFYQEKKYFTGDKIKVMQAKDFEVNVETACYFISVIRKAFKHYVWGQDSFNETVLNDTNIYLPTNSNDEIDFELMEKYIRAIEKKVIKNVVDWKDEIINKTKEIIK